MRVIVGMSGGVDSSVAAYLLMQQGYTVEGLFMKNWEEDDTSSFCSATEDEADARTVCDRLGIPLHTANFAKDYWDNVFEYFLAEFRANRTPNPDILCNKEIKFKSFLDFSLELGADAIATGHYVRSHNKNNLFVLNKGLDPDKDQSYFLCRLNQHQIKHALFPLGGFKKPQIREIAEAQGFINHNKKDSTGICFIGERRFDDFLSQYLSPKPGLIKTLDGETLGEHQGLMYYTIGQRKGLGIGGKRDQNEQPWYVAEKNALSNDLIVVQGHNHPALFHTQLDCDQLHWISPPAPVFPYSCNAKTRYRQSDQACTIIFNGDSDQLHVTFEQPQRAITPGQTIVFYQDEQCLGCGVIL